MLITEALEWRDIQRRGLSPLLSWMLRLKMRHNATQLWTGLPTPDSPRTVHYNHLEQPQHHIHIRETANLSHLQVVVGQFEDVERGYARERRCACVNASGPERGSGAARRRQGLRPPPLDAGARNGRGGKGRLGRRRAASWPHAGNVLLQLRRIANLKNRTPAFAF
jgi:hypothetical protein